MIFDFYKNMTEEKKDLEKKEIQSKPQRLPTVPQRFAEEIASMVANRLGYILPKRTKRKRDNQKVLQSAVFLDTSAIIDRRIFEVIKLRLFKDIFVVLDEILLELKHIADSQDVVRRERGQKGLELLENLKKTKIVKLIVISGTEDNKAKEVDEILIKTAKKYRGRIITCDYNLEKKASIQGVSAINMNALANCLKITAVPGEALHIKVLHHGKDVSQGVGYLDDGTMLVVENGSADVGKTVDVVVSRVIQTSAGRILFAKKI